MQAQQTTTRGSRGRLERAMGLDREEWSVHDLVDFVLESDIQTLALMHVGGDGWLKALDFTPFSAEHIRDILVAGERADGSSIFPDSGLPTGASDILLRPRVETAFLDPFAPLSTLAVLCEHCDREGRPLGVSPHTIVQRAAERVRREKDLELMALGELEYFLGRRAEEGDVYGAADRGYHATAPFVFGAEIRRRAMALLADIGVRVKYGHSEVGYVGANTDDDRIWEQHEIELALAPLGEAADAVVLSQWVLRNLAHQHGMVCSFSPVVRAGHAGSGMHFHFSPCRAGEHLGGVSAEGELGAEARSLIAGLVRFGGATMAFGNREDGSFVRLGQGKESPEQMTWGLFNRKALVRLPVEVRDAEGNRVAPPTIEFRLPDGSVHPHLLLAAVAQTFLAAGEPAEVDRLLEQSDASRESAEGGGAIPSSAEEVARELFSSREIFEAGGVFPPAFVDRTLERLRG